MKIDHNTFNQFKLHSADASKTEDLFLPSVVEVVRHMARMAVEKDYKHFLATGQIPYADPSKDGRDD